ncbi:MULTISPECIES: hypothetical protein [unclassified Marinovum]|uniref:hypothetical protein n=1 Tax=unclassified Marinovum TaxID=2647166 RepID=UPI003EDBEC9E
MLNRRRFLTAAATAPFLRPARAAGDAPDFATRDAARAWRAAGGRLDAGQRFTAGGIGYLWQPGARWIPDMADVVPLGAPGRSISAPCPTCAGDSCARATSTG